MDETRQLLLRDAKYVQQTAHSGSAAYRLAESSAALLAELEQAERERDEALKHEREALEDRDHVHQRNLKLEAVASSLVNGREGMLTVYDHRGAYRGCIGAASWDVLLAEGDAFFEQAAK